LNFKELVELYRKEVELKKKKDENKKNSGSNNNENLSDCSKNIKYTSGGKFNMDDYERKEENIIELKKNNNKNDYEGDEEDDEEDEIEKYRYTYKPFVPFNSDNRYYAFASFLNEGFKVNTKYTKEEKDIENNGKKEKNEEENEEEERKRECKWIMDVRYFNLHVSPVSCISVSNNGQLLVAGYADVYIFLYLLDY
jgi:hypothetical protein